MTTSQHFTLILVETLHHSPRLEKEILHRVNSLIRSCADKERKGENSLHRLIVAAYNNSTYTIIAEQTDFSGRGVFTSLPDLPFDKEIGYYPYGCTYHALDALMERTQTLVQSDRGDAVDVTVIATGKNNCVGRRSGKEILALIEEKEQAGWRFSYMRINVAEERVDRHSDISALFIDDIGAMGNILLRILAKAHEKEPKVENRSAEPQEEPATCLQSLSRHEPFGLNGVCYDGLSDFCRKDESYRFPQDMTGTGIYVFRNHKGQLVLEYSRLYPCFDSFDYAHENRFHRNYWTCRDEADLRRKYEYVRSHRPRCNDDYSTVRLPAFMLPALFYDDGTGVLQMASVRTDDRT